MAPRPRSPGSPGAALASSAPGSPPPEVVLGPGRPESSTVVRVASFDGPLALLLSLIEARELDVLTVPLGALAEAYLDALADLDGDRMASVSAFVAVAGQLILIKSRAMLPRPPEAAIPLPDDGPDPEAELRARLLLYRAYRDAGLALQRLAEVRHGLVRREPAAAASAALAGARPTDLPPLDPAILSNALVRALRTVPPAEEPAAIVPRTVTLADRATLIRAAIREAGVVVLQDLLRGVHDRVVVAVTFLALLELVKRREVEVEQAEPWGPIVARRRAGGSSNGRNDLEGQDSGELDERLEGYA